MCQKREECGGREMDESESKGMRQKKKEVRWKEEE